MEQSVRDQLCLVGWALAAAFFIMIYLWRPPWIGSKH